MLLTISGCNYFKHYKNGVLPKEFLLGGLPFANSTYKCIMLILQYEDTLF